jgi:hypothetical protein
MPDFNIAPGRSSAKQTESGLSVPEHDTIGLTYNVNNDPTVVTYRIGGPSGTIVATISLGYDGNNNLTSVQRVS